jgi:hypothetical protein
MREARRPRMFQAWNPEKRIDTKLRSKYPLPPFSKGRAGGILSTNVSSILNATWYEIEAGLPDEPLNRAHWFVSVRDSICCIR